MRLAVGRAEGDTRGHSEYRCLALGSGCKGRFGHKSRAARRKRPVAAKLSGSAVRGGKGAA
eukprot:8920796-Alexandrium_andersonii.AAC.1